jgi:sulfite reductase beta subunit-like hemoprotein
MGDGQIPHQVEQMLDHTLSPASINAYSSRSTDHVGIFRQKELGLTYVGLAVLVGRLGSMQLLDVLLVAERLDRGRSA